jgi:hypothetical protein
MAMRFRRRRNQPGALAVRKDADDLERSKPQSGAAHHYCSTFSCNKAGFYDPIRKGKQQTHEFDIFPPPNQPKVPGAPEPSTKFLHLNLEEMDTRVHEQTPISHSRLAPSPNAVCWSRTARAVPWSRRRSQ